MVLRGLRPNAIIYTSLNSTNTGEGKLEEENKEGKEGKKKKIRQGAIISTSGYHRLIYLCFLLFDYLLIVN
jgi:hypothetical protein